MEIYVLALHDLGHGFRDCYTLQHPNNHGVWFLLMGDGFFSGTGLLLCVVFFHTNTLQKGSYFINIKWRKISQISKQHIGRSNPFPLGPSSQHPHPDTGSREGCGITAASPGWEPEHPKSYKHRASHKHLPGLDTMISSARNLSIGLKIFPAITQASTSLNPYPPP